MRRNLTAELVTFHQAHLLEIVVGGDTVTATWHLHDKAFVPAYDVAIGGAAFYGDRVARTLTAGGSATWAASGRSSPSGR